MSATFSDGTNTVTPLLVTDYQAVRASRVVTHDIINSQSPAYRVAPASLRTGTLACLFDAQDDARAFMSMVASGNLIVLATSDDSIEGMTFLATGRNEYVVAETRNRWLVTAEYSEVQL